MFPQPPLIDWCVCVGVIRIRLFTFQTPFTWSEKGKLPLKLNDDTILMEAINKLYWIWQIRTCTCTIRYRAQHMPYGTQKSSEIFSIDARRPEYIAVHKSRMWYVVCMSNPARVVALCPGVSLCAGAVWLVDVAYNAYHLCTWWSVLESFAYTCNEGYMVLTYHIAPDLSSVGTRPVRRRSSTNSRQQQ